MDSDFLSTYACKKFSLTKGYKRAYVHTWSTKELPKELLNEILEVLRASGEIGTDVQKEDLLKKNGPKRIDLIDGGALFSPSFSEHHFNEPFSLFVNEKEFIVENPFVLGRRGECFCSCSHTTIGWGLYSLDVRIKYITLGVNGLVPTTKSSEELWNLLADIDPDEYDDALSKSKLLDLSSLWPDFSKRVRHTNSLVDTYIAELASALSNRLSDCLNLHFCEKIENRLDEDGDLSLVDGEEYLQIELDEQLADYEQKK